MRRITLAVSLALVGQGLSAQSPAAPSPGLQSAAIDAAVSRFYQTRAAPLWLEGNALSGAGRLLLDRLRTSDLDGLSDGPALAGRIEAALQTSPIAADRLLSAGWASLVATLHGPMPGARYADPLARPRTDTADRTLLLAGQAPELAAHVAAAMRKSRVYEELRAALLASPGTADPRLVANLTRARLLPARGRYLFVNPATAELTMVEDGQPVDRMRVVVGTRETPTASMGSTVAFVTLNPYWNVAEDLVRKLIAPRVVSQGIGYLKRANYEAIDRYGAGATVIPAASIDWKAVKAGSQSVKMRQLPGHYNSMGRMKFAFPNDFGIFLHDTPNKPQFAKSDRATSNGCIRLEDAPRLARWLMGSEPVATGAGADEHVRLPAPVPIYIAYITAQPKDGAIAWAPDVYALDGASAG